MKYAIIVVAAFASLMGFSASALAQSGATSYTYLEGSYQGTTFDTSSFLGENVDGTGGRFEGSLALTQNVFVVGTYIDMGLDDLSGGVPLGSNKAWEGGIGFNSKLTSGRVNRDYRGLMDRYSIFATGRYISRKTGLIANEKYTNGFAGDVGFRTINFTPFEFIAAVGYEDFEKVDGEFTLEARLLYEVVTNLQIQGGWDWKNDERSAFFLGLRYNFPKVAIF